MSHIIPADTHHCPPSIADNPASFSLSAPTSIAIEGSKQEVATKPLTRTIVCVSALIVRYMILLQEDLHFQRETEHKAQKESYTLSKHAVSKQYNAAYCSIIGAFATASIASFGLSLQLSETFRDLTANGVHLSKNSLNAAQRAFTYFYGDLTQNDIAQKLLDIAPTISTTSIPSTLASGVSGTYQASQTQYNNEASLVKGRADDARSRAQSVKDQLRQVESLFEKCVELSRSAAPRG